MFYKQIDVQVLPQLVYVLVFKQVKSQVSGLLNMSFNVLSHCEITSAQVIHKAFSQTTVYAGPEFRSVQPQKNWNILATLKWDMKPLTQFPRHPWFIH